MFRNILCSGSADTLVILWDIKEAKAARVLKQHKDKVSITLGNMEMFYKCVQSV